MATALGEVYYEVQAKPDLALNLDYDLVLVWGTLPAANDQVVLEKLTAARSNSGTDSEGTFDHQGRAIEFRLYQGQMQALPSDLAQLTHLRTLELSGIPLADLPSVLVRLPNLQSLTLIGIAYTDFPSLLSKLTQLRVLRMHGNGLTSRTPPPELGKLTHLEVLNSWGGCGDGGGDPTVVGNALTGPIPPDLGQLSQLEVLSLANSRPGGCGR